MGDVVMSDALDTLVKLLTLEALDVDLYRGMSQDLGYKQLYGGQVIGQCLGAAGYSVPEDRIPHSLHGYFLRRGDPDKPVIYQVDRIHEGGSFSTRRVLANQNGLEIFSCIASFQRPEKGFEHAPSMPDIPGPDDLPTESELAKIYTENSPAFFKEMAMRERPIEVRPIDPMNLFMPEKREAHRCAWFRANGTLPNKALLHQLILSYLSDFGLLITSLYPHGYSFYQPFMQVASIDHAIWFQSECHLNDWHLYVIDSPWAGGGRGFSRGQIYNQFGVLVASTTQEGLIRKKG